MQNVEVLRELGSVIKFKADDYIFKEGDSGNSMYIILSGKVEVYINSFSDPPVKVSEMGPGEFFGEMCILENQPRSATVLAVKDTVVLSINKLNFEAFISRRPGMAYKIMKGLSTRIRMLNEELSKLREQVRKLNPSEESSEKSPGESSEKEPREHSDKSADKTCEKNHGCKSEINTQDDGKKSTGATTVIKDSVLFPSGHKSYDKNASEFHETYLFNKQVKCPMCGKAFDVKMQRPSKLKLDRVDYDFRRRYVDFEPMWYSIWVCPGCYYSGFYYDFESVNKSYGKLIMEKTGELRKSGFSTEFSNPRTINQVFTAYYLAILCAGVYKAPPLKFAKLWLQLSWLYKDLDDDEMFKIASEKALGYYYEAFYDSKLNVTAEEEQQCCLILGELFLLKGDEKEAAKHFYKAINRNSGSRALNQQAQDRLQDMKSISGT